MHELLAEGNLAVADEVLASDCVNVALGGADASAVKAMVTALNAAVRGQRFADEELVAEGDVVTARFKYILTLPDGSTVEAGTLAYYRLVDGRIVVNDVMSVPDLMEVLGPLMAPLEA